MGLVCLDTLLWEPQSDANNWIDHHLGCSSLAKYSEDSRAVVVRAKEFPLVRTQVRNTRKGGIVVAAPPCSSWIFLMLACELGSLD